MTEAPKTIWVETDPGYDSLVVYPEPHCDLSGTEGYVHYTLTSHAEAEKRKAVNSALDALEAELERLMDESSVWFSDTRSEELTFEAIRKLKVPE